MISSSAPLIVTIAASGLSCGFWSFCFSNDRLVVSTTFEGAFEMRQLSTHYSRLNMWTLMETALKLEHGNLSKPSVLAHAEFQ